MPAAFGRRLIRDRSQAKSACRRPSMTRLPISPTPVKASTAVLGSCTLASALKSVLGQAKQPPLLQPKPISKLWPAGTPTRLPKTVSTTRAPLLPCGMMLQLKILLVQVRSEAAMPVSVRVRLCQLTPDILVKCSVPAEPAEIANVKVSAFTAVQE